jgi:hypothetical protein
MVAIACGSTTRPRAVTPRARTHSSKYYFMFTYCAHTKDARTTPACHHPEYNMRRLCFI